MIFKLSLILELELSLPSPKEKPSIIFCWLPQDLATSLFLSEGTFTTETLRTLPTARTEAAWEIRLWQFKLVV